MAYPPKALRSLRESGVFEITWHEGVTYQMPFQFLRGRCPCANCVDEMTGRRVVDVQDVPTAIEIVAAQFQGNYALKITWNDKHDTGLFTWEYLRELCNRREWEIL